MLHSGEQTGVRLDLVDLVVVHPAAQGWGISVIISGEIPVVVNTAVGTTPGRTQPSRDSA